MKLDPKESINNMGTLRVKVMDAADLPSADRNGFSDPYCKFRIGDDGEVIYKTKVQKKTLHPAWNEYFETPIKTRIGADFHVDVYDWDFGDKADFLGASAIDLESLTPFEPADVHLPLNGKSGAIHLNLLFKPSYVVRSRQGSSTFSGTFAVPGKIVGAPVKGVGFVGGNVVRGASFLKHGVMSRFSHKDKGEDDASIVNSTIDEDETPTAERGLSPATALTDQPNGTHSPTPSTPQKEHSRNRSTASAFGDRLSIIGGSSSSAETGTANITVANATGFPGNAHVRVIIKAQSGKNTKEFKTKAIKTSSGIIQYQETFKITHTTADTQYQIRVVDHSTFGSDTVLGDAPYFVANQGSEENVEKAFPIGEGSVTLRSSFVPADVGAGGLRPTTSHSTTGQGLEDGSESPERKLPRRSFLSKRQPSSGGQ